MNSRIEKLTEDCLYNYDLKIKFLSDMDISGASDLSIRNLIKDLSNISSAEKFYNKDFMNFTASEVKNALELAGMTRVNSMSSHKSSLAAYVEWCQEHGYSIYKTEHPIISMKPSDLSSNLKLEKEYFKDEKSFFGFMDELFPDKNEATLGKLQAELYLYLCWYGLSSEEILSLSEIYINFDKRSISSPIDKYEIKDVPFRVMRTLGNCIDTIKRNKYDRSKNVNVFRSKNIEDVLKHPDGEKNFKTKLSIIFKEQGKGIKFDSENFGKRVKPTTVAESGQFYRLYLYESENNLIKFDRKITAKKKPEYLELFFRKGNAVILYATYISWLNFFYGDEEKI